MKKPKFKKRYVLEEKPVGEIICSYGYLVIPDDLRQAVWDHGHPVYPTPGYRLILERIK